MESSTPWGKAAGTAIGAYFGGPIGAQAGGEIGGMVDSLAGPKDYYATHQYKRGIREARRNATWNLENIYGKQVQTRVTDAKAAGLHPLAALGVSMGPSAPASTPNIPGQSNNGSAIADATRALSNVAEQSRSRSHSERIQALSLQEQQLRNDWLEAQIKNEEARRLAALANAAGRGSQAEVGPGGEIAVNERQRVSLSNIANTEDWEKRYGEPGGLVMSPVVAGSDVVHNLVDQAVVDQLIDQIQPPMQDWHTRLRNLRALESGKPQNTTRPKYLAKRTGPYRTVRTKQYYRRKKTAPKQFYRSLF
ncbi:DNA pilot protein [Microviridae sp.]|nr:DNA pilot protein [Microviridae sp.]